MKFKNLTYLLVLIALVSFSACNGGNENKDENNEVTENIKYYRHLLFTESPFDDIKGIHELTAEEAKTINNYKFTYDEKNRPVSVKFCRDSILLNYSSLGAAKVTFEYTDSTESRLYFDKDGNEKVVNGEVFKSVYSIGENGLRNGLKFYGKDGEQIENRNKIAFYKWEKLPDGLVKENRFNLAGEEVVMNQFCPFYELRFEYDENGFVKQMSNYQGDTLYNCTAENCGDIGVSYFSFDLSEKGDLQKFVVRNTVGQLSNLYWGWAKFERTIDENGYMTEIKYWDQDDEFLSGKSVPVYQYKYDEHGSVIEVAALDAEKNIINNPQNGIAITEYKYDEMGHPTDTIKYDKEKVIL